MIPKAHLHSGTSPLAHPAASAQTWWSSQKAVTWHAVLVAICTLLYFVTSPATIVTLSGMMVAPYFFWIVYLEWKRSPVKVTPISVYFFWQGFALGVAAIYMGFKLQSGESLPFGRHLLSPASIAGGYIIGLVGTLPLHAGLQAFRPKPTKAIVDYDVNTLLPQLAIMFVVGTLVLGLADKISFLGAIMSSFELAGHAALFSFLSIPRERLKLPEATRVGTLLLCTLALLLASTRTGAKLFYMLAVLGLLIYALESKRVARHLPLIGAFFLLMYLTVVAPTVAKSRQLRSIYGLGQIEAQIEAFKTASPLYTGEFNSEFYGEQAENLASRLFESSSIAFIFQEVQVRGFLNGETFARLKYAFIPRILWPDKPWVAQGGWFTTYTGASPREQDATFALGMEASGELYWNFGIAGLLIGMFVLGAMQAGLWTMAGEDPRLQPLRMCLYTYISLGMANLPEASTRIVSCVVLFLVYGLLIFLFNRHRRSSPIVFDRPRFGEVKAGLN